MMDTCMCWGFEHGDGWYDLIDTLCGRIQYYIDNHVYVDQVVAEQVKEKFGGLRFTVRGGNEATDAYIRFAEDMSFKLCEVCGNSGRLRKNGFGWLSTLCDEHDKSRHRKDE